MSFLLIPAIRVRGANLLSTQLVLGGPPVMASVLFAHALTIRAKLGARALGVALVHHAITPLGDFHYGRFNPQQRRSAAFTFTNKADKDYSSKNRQALSLQPTASAHLRLSLLIELDRPTPTPDAVSVFLSTARFAGGQIVGHGRVEQVLDIDDAFDRLTTGFAVLDRRDLLQRAEYATPAHALVAAVGTRPTDERDAWLSATCVGYAAITPPAIRPGARDADLGCPHAFAEPMVGLVQFRSLRQLDRPPEAVIWRPRWMRDDVYVVQQAIEATAL